MYLRTFLLVALLLVITGCSSSGSVTRTKAASQTVDSTKLSEIENVSIQTLHDSFQNPHNPSKYIERVIEASGEVVAFSMKDGIQYTVTIKQGDAEAICLFDDSISDKLGDSRKIRFGVELTIRGKCYSSGLFSINPFTLDGCRLVNN